MSTSSQSLAKTENPYVKAFGIICVVSILLLTALLKLFGAPLAAPASVLVVVVLLWAAVRHPIFYLGVLLAFIPMDPLALLLARFFGPSFFMSDMVKAFDRILFLPPLFILWWRNGIKLRTPDWFLLACFGLAVVRFIFGGELVALIYDFDFMIAYAAGRLAVLTVREQESWATRAVWIVAVLSVLGMIEVFILGEGPRTLLYLAVQESATEGAALNGTYHASGVMGMRESATMFGPSQFGILCMVALIIWWVYRRDLVPASMIGGGLILTLSRSGWVGAAVAISLLGIVMRQRKRFLLYASLALALFVAAIPVVGLGDFLSATINGQEVSAEGHKQSLFEGMTYVLGHPFGSGPGSAGTLAFKNDSFIVWSENSYLTLASAYGIPTAVCFVGFLISALGTIWSQRTRLTYAAVGILVGFSTVMMFLAAIHDVFSLAAWVWFPVGLAIRNSTSPAMMTSSQHGSTVGTA
jgi:O-Antigen ligase